MRIVFPMVFRVNVRCQMSKKTMFGMPGDTVVTFALSLNIPGLVA